MSNARKLADNLPSVGQLGSRNLIINGAMQVAQRGTQTNQVSAYTACDRWQFLESGASIVTTSQSSTVPSGQGFANSLKIDVTTADTSVGASEYAMVRTKLEGQDVQHLKYGTSSAEQVTLSFWVRSPKTGIHVAELRHRDASGGTEYINQQYTITTANTWQKVETTFVGQTTDAFDDNNDVSLEIVFWLMSGSNYGGGTFVSNTWATTSSNRAAGQVNVMDSTSNNFYLTGVQLEVGPQSTPFEHEPHSVTLAKCQRYFQTHYTLGSGVQNSTTGTILYTALPVTMRTKPSITTRSGVYTNINVEHDDTYDVTDIGNTHGADGGLEEKTSFSAYATTSGSNTVGNGVCVMCDRNNDSFEFEAEL